MLISQLLSYSVNCDWLEQIELLLRKAFTTSKLLELLNLMPRFRKYQHYQQELCLVCHAGNNYQLSLMMELEMHKVLSKDHIT